MHSHRASRAAPATTSRGFTLVEAAIVTAIAAITLSAAAPDFSGFIERQRLDGVASQREVRPLAPLLAVEQPGVDELLQVVRHGRLGHPHRGGHVAHARLLTR